MNRRTFIPLLLGSLGTGPQACLAALGAPLRIGRSETRATRPLPGMSRWALNELGVSVQPVCDPGGLTGRPAGEIRVCERLWQSIDSMIAMGIWDHSGARPAGRAIQPGVIFHELTAAPHPSLYLSAYHFDSADFRIFPVGRISVHVA